MPGDEAMKDRKPKIAVVGCGYWGKNLIRNFNDLGSLAAVCDTDAAHLRDAAETYGVPAVASYDDLLSNEDIDGVVIAAPAAQHYELARKALLAGKDVFVEKPIALHVHQGQHLEELATHHARILMVGHLLLYHPAIRELKRLISAGELGKIQYIYSSRLNWGKVRTEENILWSFAPHDISAILYLLEEEPNAVAANGASYLDPRTTDITLSTLEFASGVKAHIFVSWLHPFKEQKLVIVGGRKLAVFDDTAKGQELCLYPHRIDWRDRVPIAHKTEAEIVPLADEEPLRVECQHFLDCIRDRRRPLTDGPSAVRVLNILELCDRSLQKAAPSALPSSKLDYFVHPTAVVDEPSEIGAGTHIWHFSHVMPNSRIGRGCNLGQNVHVASGVRIGNNVKIQNNVSVYTGVELEDDVFCGPSAVFTNVINPRSHVARKDEYRSTRIRRGASLGANSTIVCGVSVGEYAFVAAGAVVTKDVPAYALVMGVPAKQVGWMCMCGARLQLTKGEAICRECAEEYTLRNSVLEPLAGSITPLKFPSSGLEEAIALMEPKPMRKRRSGSKNVPAYAVPENGAA
jgi:UDP-2-acetamido-3-amino-2,3-dideoxy-glucuronate N-acetyltransferase